MTGKRRLDNQYTKAKKLNLPQPKQSLESIAKGIETKRKNGTLSHKPETKKKLSEARIRYLKENPDKVPYKLNHYSKGRSYAEEYWKNVLDSFDILYEEQYQISLYSLDFALVDLKIDLEIDGDQHHLDQRIVESDKRRTQFLENLGWKVIRIKWSEYLRLDIDERKKYINGIINQLSTR